MTSVNSDRTTSGKLKYASGIETDTIAAIATPAGKGGIGIVRLSGPEAQNILVKIIGKKITPRYATLASFLDQQGEKLDRGLALFFPAPHSFTGEHVAELHGHGGPVIIDLLLSECLSHGARLAKPGEYSERAYHNNKLDLVQAEAIADLINSASANAARAAARSLSGDFSIQINKVAEEIKNLRVYVEASIDFPEEEIDFLTEGQVSQKAQKIVSELKLLLISSEQGVLLRDGIRLVIAGKPNVGKSSLLNCLVGFDRAIVTAHAGTTRDSLSESITLKGLPITFVDTAGLRTTNDVVELEGIKRTHEEIKKADRIILVRDASIKNRALEEELEELNLIDNSDENKKTNDRSDFFGRLLLVNNKMDLIGENLPTINISGNQSVINISALTGAGVDNLVEEIIQLVGYQQQTVGFSARRRHIESLNGALTALELGISQLNTMAAGELFAEDLKCAHMHCGDILGHMSSDELLGEIFSSFCIGK
ncbi:MAG: tRNA uridine-5-carboxymethylaminomethyl(34) synthesis GTPase MnmE [Pseudomonadales bacterium]|nr:tRNA uridine-5-carboxymethylaminomethyl(34) synthesis GTPase MnmE [Pseudomonadales bacterium]